MEIIWEVLGSCAARLCQAPSTSDPDRFASILELSEVAVMACHGVSCNFEAESHQEDAEAARVEACCGPSKDGSYPIPRVLSSNRRTHCFRMHRSPGQPKLREMYLTCIKKAQAPAASGASPIQLSFHPVQFHGSWCVPVSVNGVFQYSQLEAF